MLPSPIGTTKIQIDFISVNVKSYDLCLVVDLVWAQVSLSRLTVGVVPCHEGSHNWGPGSGVAETSLAARGQLVLFDRFPPRSRTALGRS